MANFLSYFFWNHLPYIEEEVRYINGKEEPCLIIPTATNQIERGRGGNWLSTLRISEIPPNEKMITHEIQLGYSNWDEVNKARNLGRYEKSQHLGRVYVHDRTPSKKIDITNNALDIHCVGAVILSDIPKDLIIRNEMNGKRYIRNLVFRPTDTDSYQLTGGICIDDIPREDILTNPDNGKKYINTVFKKLKYLDTYMNTHQLMVVRTDGSELEIGKFKLWQKQGAPTPVMPQSLPNNGEVNPTTNSRTVPKSIDGFKF